MARHELEQVAKRDDAHPHPCGNEDKNIGHPLHQEARVEEVEDNWRGRRGRGGEGGWERGGGVKEEREREGWKREERKGKGGKGREDVLSGRSLEWGGEKNGRNKMLRILQAQSYRNNA